MCPEQMAKKEEYYLYLDGQWTWTHIAIEQIQHNIDLYTHYKHVIKMNLVEKCVAFFLFLSFLMHRPPFVYESIELKRIRVRRQNVEK